MDKKMFAGIADEAVTLLALLTAPRPLLSMAIRFTGVALVAWLREESPEAAVRIEMVDEITRT